MTLSATHENAGTNVLTFLTVPLDARSVGFGNAGSGRQNGVYGVLENPSSLGYIENAEAMISYHPIILDVRAGNMGYARRYEGVGVFAGNLTYLSSGEIEEYENRSGAPYKTGRVFNPFSLALGATYAREVFSGMAVAATLKGIYDNLGAPSEDPLEDRTDRGEYRALGLGFDLGWQYRTFADRLCYGVHLKNVGVLVSGYTDKYDGEPLPTEVSAGVSYNPRYVSALQLAFDLRKAIDDYLAMEGGIEVAIYKDIFKLRGGIAGSQKDIAELFRRAFGEGDEAYQKSNWGLFAIGAGVDAPVGATRFHIDAAVQFRAQHIPLDKIITIGMEF